MLDLDSEDFLQIFWDQMLNLERKEKGGNIGTTVGSVYAEEANSLLNVIGTGDFGI